MKSFIKNLPFILCFCLTNITFFVGNFVAKADNITVTNGTNTGAGSLRNAVLAPSTLGNDTIFIARNVPTITLNSTITINKDVVIISLNDAPRTRITNSLGFTLGTLFKMDIITANTPSFFFLGQPTTYTLQ